MARPLKFKSRADLEARIQRYFDAATAQGRPLTVTGLALELDTTRETLLDYQSRDTFSDTIKRAKLRIENYAEERLFTGKGTAGVIFNLKNNFAWRNTPREKTEQERPWWEENYAHALLEADRIVKNAEERKKRGEPTNLGLTRLEAANATGDSQLHRH